MGPPAASSALPASEPGPDRQAISRSFRYWPFGGIAQDQCASYSYDGFDRLTSRSGCSPSSYAYDGLDRLRLAGLTTLHYDGLNPSVAIESGSVDTHYALDPQGRRLALSQQTATPTLQYLSDDGQGNVSTITSSGAAVSCQTRFDPWGNIQGSPCGAGSTPNTAFYLGARQDPATGAYQFGFRTRARPASSSPTPSGPGPVVRTSALAPTRSPSTAMPT